MNDLQHFKNTYITECNELLADMEERLLAIDENNPDNEDLHAIFRCAHSIKGGAGAFGFDYITSFTHILEGLLDAMREDKIPVTRDAIDTLLASADILKTMVAAAQNNEKVSDALWHDVAEQLQGIARDGGVKGMESSLKKSNAPKEKIEESNEISIIDIAFLPHQNLFMSGNEPLLIIRELKSIGEVTLGANITKLPDIESIDPEICYISWDITLETEKTMDQVKEVFEFVEDDCELKIEKIAGFTKPAASGSPKKQEESNNDIEAVEVADLPSVGSVKSPAAVAPQNSDNANSAKAPAVNSIRVDIDKIDRLVNMVGELVITQAMITAQSRFLPMEEHLALLSGIDQLSQHTVELQEAVMAVRMQPVKSVFSRMPRIVRDLSKQLNKDIRLEMYGENTELDKTVIEQLTDPLMHMIRNSVDHGIESSADDRIKAGKHKQGVIRLSAEHCGGKIVIKIEDDGRGINREKVLQKAREKGLVAPDANLTETEIDHLIFMPGFSTAETVSNISGRGVGMDVVKRNIEGLGGAVSILNRPGNGSTVMVSLPLTLAILDGMIVRVGREKYIVPIVSIIETLRPRKEDIRKIADGNDTINVRGEFISVLYLSRLFNINGAVEDASRALVILIEAGSDKFGLVVDELIGQQQVVIKSLEENSDAVPGISAATILGDGQVSLILDVTGLQNLSYNANNKMRKIYA